MSRIHGLAAAGVAVGFGVFNGYYVFNPALKEQKEEQVQSQQPQQQSSTTITTTANPTEPEIGDGGGDASASREAGTSPYASPYAPTQDSGSVWARIRGQVSGVLMPGDVRKGFKAEDVESEERYR